MSLLDYTPLFLLLDRPEKRRREGTDTVTVTKAARQELTSGDVEVLEDYFAEVAPLSHYRVDLSSDEPAPAQSSPDCQRL